MTIKTSIINLLVSIGNAILKWFGETAKEEQKIKQVVNIEVNSEKPYVKMPDSVKKFLVCDMSEEEKIDTYAQIAIYEAAKVDPYRIILDNGDWYKIHNGQIVESHKGA